MRELFKKLTSDNDTLNRVQDNIISTLNPIAQDRLLNRKTITANITTAGVTVAHGLGYIPNGYIVIDQLGAASIYRTAWDKLTITLASSANVTATLIIF